MDSSCRQPFLPNVHDVADNQGGWRVLRCLQHESDRQARVALPNAPQLEAVAEVELEAGETAPR